MPPLLCKWKGRLSYPSFLLCLSLDLFPQIITATVVACLRRSLNWSLVSTLDEFEKFAGTEWDLHDILFIENFEPSLISPSLS
jgi:hypothetical protein